MLEYWGERCEDYEEGCVVCDAWREYDNLVTDNKVANEMAQKAFTEVNTEGKFVPPISLTKVQKPTLSEWMAWLKQGEK
jgi:hypothetical protein